MGTLLYLVNNMSRSNALVVSQTAIAAGIGAKRESVNRALKYLREHNFIQSVKAGGATVYVVNSKVACRGTGENVTQPSAPMCWPSRPNRNRT